MSRETNRIIPDSECKQGKCGCTTTGCVGKCALEQSWNATLHVSTNPTEAEMLLQAELSAMKQRAEAAEARIKTSQEQAPFGYWHVGSCDDECDFFLSSESGDVSCPDCVVLYAAPVIPPGEGGEDFRCGNGET